VPLEFGDEQVFGTLLDLGFYVETIRTDVFEAQKGTF
jgi:hypothetical protein